MESGREKNFQHFPKENYYFQGVSQVAPAEVEAILIGHPSVLDAAVIGIKDERHGEVPKAFVVLKPGAKADADELKKYVAGEFCIS